MPEGGKVSAEQTERARMLPKSQTHSDTHPVCQRHRIAVLSCFILPGLPSQALARQLSQRESPWQRGFVFDETDCVCWKTSRNAKASHFGRGVCGADGEGKDAAKEPDTQRYAPCLSETSYRCAFVFYFAGLALSGAGAPALPKGEPLAKRFRFR